MSTEVWNIGCHTGASSDAKFLRRKALHSSGPLAFPVLVHRNTLLTSSSVMVILSEGAGITALSISVHFEELSNDSNLAKNVFRSLLKAPSFSVKIGLDGDDIPVIDFIVSHVFL